MALGWSGTIEGDPFQIYHSSSIGDGGDNYVHYINEELDGLIEQARRELDQEKRTALWHKIHHILWEDQPYTYMHNRKSVRYIDKRVQNVRKSKIGIVFPQHLSWFVPREMQKYAN
jgi:peptide/nickel transport system substrate-binding protein